MPRKRDLILANLARKGFERLETGDHHQLLYRHTADGARTTHRTKISRGSSHKDVSDANLGRMARQVGLTNAEFLYLIDCPLSRETYERVVACRRALGFARAATLATTSARRAGRRERTPARLYTALTHCGG